MFKRLLIANRGEIACRVIRTARRLGIGTVAVYSDADADARHVRLADEAWRLGPAPARDSYLSIDAILAAAAGARADAIHPGYGFLSESAPFAEACVARGLCFVGPPAEAITAMGSKIAAKRAMAVAGVPVLPGYQGDEQSLERLRDAARELGFPLIIKPSGGGGGKGMQIVTRADELEAALEGARRLAASAFKDPSLLIERYLPSPRHVEVQVLCDAHGHALHLGTRDCSVQRRHQKLLEEAPAPDIAPAVRERLHQAALRVARAVGYVSAGTVEFLYADGEFWFMEMNTRLQVEHTVTERIFGLDLVEWQLRIAAGEPLSFTQADLSANGSAVEARLCAEDPGRDFTPSAGRIDWLRWPQESPGLRVDAGFDGGDEVPSHYDSLLGKLIGHGTDRCGAVAALLQGLQTLRIVGVDTNAAWLAAALKSPDFVDRVPTTRFVADHPELAVEPVTPDVGELAVAALSVVLDLGGGAITDDSPWAARDAFRINQAAMQKLTLRVDGSTYQLELAAQGALWRVHTEASEDCVLNVAPDRDGSGLDVRIGTVRRRLDWWRSGRHVFLWRGARRIDLELLDPRQGAVLAPAHDDELIARLPGTVVATPVSVGQRVEAGATLLVVEAMKMEHAIRAPYAGVVARVHFALGERVTEGAVLIDLTENTAIEG